MNTLGGKTAKWLWPLTPESLCAEAQRRTGLHDFGSPSLEPALSVLLTSLENEANLHPLGRFLMRFHLRDVLETRLRLNLAWKTDGAGCETAPLQRPVFIVGMPRSGSTFLHEVLAEDPDNRAPRVWEIMFPVGDPRRGESDRRRRVRKAEACLWWFRRLARGADSVYPMRALTPHECVAIHSYTFLSEEFVSTCRIPTYETFLRSADLTPAYLWQKRFLQHLQNGEVRKRWVLKSPDHVHGLEELFIVFPDAMIIQTHRDPFQVLRSSAELTRVLHGLYGRAGDPGQMAAREATVLADGTERFIEFRDAHPELAGRFIDVKYSELVTDPLGTVRQIYERLSFPLTATALTRMKSLASHRSRYKSRRVHADPAESRDKVPAEARRFERYCARFGLSY